MNIRVFTEAALKPDPESALLIPLFENDPTPFGHLVSAELRVALETVAKHSRFSGKAEQCFVYPTPGREWVAVAALGLGPTGEFDAETVRRVVGTARSQLSKLGVSGVTVDGTALGDGIATAALDAIVLGQYDFDRYKEKKDCDEDIVSFTAVINEDVNGALKALTSRLVVLEGANWARDLGNRSSNDVTPSMLASEAEAMASSVNCACTVIAKDDMQALGMGALLGVAQGSAEPPKLILLEYTHNGDAPTMAMVGKGVTFDTGGISLKPSLNMHEMKFDMLGAAAVLGAFKSIAQLKPKVNVVCAVPTVENMNSGTAQRPGDIVKAYNGKTIEVYNTDAEGRLILADALSYVVERYKPKCVVDLATLTGAIVVGLGHYAAGLFSNDDELAAAIEGAAAQSGERVWRMPLWKDYSKLIEGTHADLCNIGPQGEAGSITAACFLKEFVGDTPWAHVDIAGVAWGAKNISYQDPKHAAGYGVRLLTEWIMGQG